MTMIEKIYRAYSDDVYRFAYWLCGDVTEAEDIVSETFVRLWGNVENLQVGTVKAYVLTIARNVFISQRRRIRRERQLPDEPRRRRPEDKQVKSLQRRAENQFA